MPRRLAPLGALAAATLLVPGARAAGPQLVDEANDANGVNGQAVVTVPALSGTPTPVGSQPYADVLSIEWRTVRSGGRPTGFSVVMKLAGPPTPLDGTIVVYRLLGTPSCGEYFGVVYYSKRSSDPAIPQAAVRDDCTGENRLTPVALPVIRDKTVTWTVPLAALPKGLPVRAGSVLADLRFEVVEIEDFQGHRTPDAGQGTSYEGIYGLGLGRLDMGSSASSYTVGS